MNQICHHHATTFVSTDVQTVGNLLTTREAIEEWIKRFSEEAIHGCGCSYELFVKRFSTLIDSNIDAIEPVHQAMAMEIARQHDYASPDDLKKMQQDIEESGGCSVTGIDAECCPCGRHE